MGLWDKKDWKIDQPIGIKSEADQRSINIERQRAQFLGKVMREARRNGDLKGYLAVEAAGYKDRGIENVDDKNRRYLDKVQQDRFYGDAAVGPGQQPAKGAQQPFGGEAIGNGSGNSPKNARSSLEGSSGGEWVNTGGASSGSTQPLPPNTPPPTGTAQPATPTMSAAEQSKQATLEKTLAGNFGKVAQARAEAQQSGGTYDATPSFDTRTEGRKAFVDTVGTLRGKDGGITPKEKEQAQARGAALGLTPQQIQDTLDGETELSPEAIAERAKGRKDAAYQKEFGDSDKKIEEAIAGLDKTKFTPEQIAQIKENMKGLSSQDRKDSTEKAATSRAEREQKRFEKETVAKQELDTYNPLGDALDRLEQASASAGNLQNHLGARDRKGEPHSGVLRPEDNRPSVGEFMNSLNNSTSPLDKRPEIDASGMLADQQPILDETALRSDAKPRTLRNDLEATLKGLYDVTIGDYQRYNIKNNAEANKAKEQGKLKENDALINAINYIHGNTGDAKLPTSDDISYYAQKNKVSLKEAKKVLEQKSANARGEQAPKPSIDTNNASKEFRSGYDNLKALESFTI